MNKLTTDAAASSKVALGSRYIALFMSAQIREMIFLNVWTRKRIICVYIVSCVHCLSETVTTNP